MRLSHFRLIVCVPFPLRGDRDDVHCREQTRYGVHMITCLYYFSSNSFIDPSSCIHAFREGGIVFLQSTVLLRTWRSIFVISCRCDTQGSISDGSNLHYDEGIYLIPQHRRSNIATSSFSALLTGAVKSQ